MTYDICFVASKDDDFVVATSIRTSCSSGIYAPFGVRVRQCSDHSDFYVHVSCVMCPPTSLAEGESEREFVDGKSARVIRRRPSLTALPQRRARLHFQAWLTHVDIAGFLTIDSEMVVSSMDCDDEAFGSLGRVNSRKTNSSSRAPFVDCSDK